MNANLPKRPLSAVLTPLVVAGALLAGLFGAPVANAGIILGDRVDMGIYAPTENELCFLCGGITTVIVEDGDGDSVEPYLSGAGWFDVDINPTSISIRFNRDIAWQSGDFIGLVISDIDWLEGSVRAIPGASLLASGAAGALPELTAEFNNRLRHTDSSVVLNWQGLSIAAGTRFEISLQAMAAAQPPAMQTPPVMQTPPGAVDVPEPAALFLLLALLAVAGARQLERRRNAVVNGHSSR